MCVCVWYVRERQREGESAKERIGTQEGIVVNKTSSRIVLSFEILILFDFGSWR